MSGDNRQNRAKIRHVQEHVSARQRVANAGEAREHLCGPSRKLRFLDSGHDASKTTVSAVHKA